MDNYNGKLVELPKKGKALIITDIHGNLTDFEKLMYIWDEFKETKDNHLVLTGDFIHALGPEDDNSLEILDDVEYRYESSSNFHVLLGNHEWSTISNKSLFKAGMDQTFNFDNLLKENFGEHRYKEKLDHYIKFFKKLPIAVRTANNIFISHAGPPTNIKNLDEIRNIADEGFNTDNSKLFQILWNRPDDFDKNMLDSFLKAMDCKMMIVGHTPVDGIELIYDNQLIVSSSYGKGKKAYVELDLEKDVKGSKDLLKMVRYLK